MSITLPFKKDSDELGAPGGKLGSVPAIAKTQAAPGLEITDFPEPLLKPGHVKIKVAYGSVCGTDLHIYKWDPWAASRVKPPLIIGHEFCGTIVEVGEGVDPSRMGQFVASESHIVCGQCRQCLSGQAHVCVNTTILGVDVDGGFRPVTVIPADNARLVPASVPLKVASMLDAVGNAVHTVMAGPVEGQSVLITGMGPIGLFAVAICKVLGAKKIYATEVSSYRIELAKKLGADVILNPAQEDVSATLSRAEPLGIDAALEMSGHPSSFELAVQQTRPGGRVSLLGVFPDALAKVDMNQVVFKGIDLQGIVGRRLWQTWDQMNWLFEEKGLDLTPVVTHEMPYTQISEAMEILKAGNAGKIALSFS